MDSSKLFLVVFDVVVVGGGGSDGGGGRIIANKPRINRQHSIDFRTAKYFKISDLFRCDHT